MPDTRQRDDGVRAPSDDGTPKSRSPAPQWQLRQCASWTPTASASGPPGSPRVPPARPRLDPGSERTRTGHLRTSPEPPAGDAAPAIDDPGGGAPRWPSTVRADRPGEYLLRCPTALSRPAPRPTRWPGSA